MKTLIYQCIFGFPLNMPQTFIGKILDLFPKTGRRQLGEARMKVFSKFSIGIFKGRGRVGVLLTPPLGLVKTDLFSLIMDSSKNFPTLIHRECDTFDYPTLAKERDFLPPFNQLNILAHY